MLSIEVTGLLLMLLFISSWGDCDPTHFITAQDEHVDFTMEVPCLSYEVDLDKDKDSERQQLSTGCLPRVCKRRVVDDLFTGQDIQRLHDIAAKGDHIYCVYRCLYMYAYLRSYNKRLSY